MAIAEDGQDEARKIERLEAVRSQVRALMCSNPRVAEAFKKAVPAYVDLIRSFLEENRSGYARQLELARSVLERGLLTDPAAPGGLMSLRVQFPGLCPVALAPWVLGGEDLEKASAEIVSSLAKGAASALDCYTRFESPDLPDDDRTAMTAESREAVESGEFVDVHWEIEVRRPPDWIDPVPPWNIEPEHLRRLSDADYRTVAIFHLGGLADIRATRERILELDDSACDEGIQELLDLLASDARFPIGGNEDPDKDEITPLRFPPDVAEEMLEWVERRSRKEGLLTKRGGSSAEGSDDYRPSKWFDEATGSALYADLLRMAAHSGRLKDSYKGCDNRWFHSIAEICDKHPQYRAKILAAWDRESDQP
jgi:hypothetical protein